MKRIAPSIKEVKNIHRLESTLIKKVKLEEKNDYTKQKNIHMKNILENMNEDQDEYEVQTSEDDISKNEQNKKQ